MALNKTTEVAHVSSYFVTGFRF